MSSLAAEGRVLSSKVLITTRVVGYSPTPLDISYTQQKVDLVRI